MEKSRQELVDEIMSMERWYKRQFDSAICSYYVSNMFWWFIVFFSIFLWAEDGLLRESSYVKYGFWLLFTPTSICVLLRLFLRMIKAQDENEYYKSINEMIDK